MFLVTYTYRNASSGSESITKKLFETIEEAAEYIQTEWYDSLCEINYYPEEWNEENLGRPMPSRSDFSLEAIQKIRGTVVFAPYDNHHAIVQNELRLDNLK